MKQIFGYIILSFTLWASCKAFRKELTPEEIEIAKKYIEKLDNYGNKDWQDPNDLLLYYKPDDEPQVEEPIVKEIKRPELKSEKIDEVSGINENKDAFTIFEQEQYGNNMFHDNKTCYSSDNVFITRWLKMLLKALNSDLGTTEQRLLRFTIDNDQIQKINDILSTESPNMVDVEHIIQDIVSTVHITERNSFYELFQTLCQISKSTIYEMRDILIFFFIEITVAVTVIFICWKCRLSNRFTTLLVIMCVSIIWHWTQLYRKAVAEKMATVQMTNYEAACRPTDLNIFTTISMSAKSWFVISPTCEEFYKAINVDPFYEITPSMAISATFTTFIVYPYEITCGTINRCMKILFSGLSVWSSSILITFLFVYMLMHYNYRIKIPILGTALAIEPTIIQNSSGILQPIRNIIHLMLGNGQNQNIHTVESEAMVNQLQGTVTHKRALPLQPQVHATRTIHHRNVVVQQLQRAAPSRARERLTPDNSQPANKKKPVDIIKPKDQSLITNIKHSNTEKKSQKKLVLRSINPERASLDSKPHKQAKDENSDSNFATMSIPKDVLAATNTIYIHSSEHTDTMNSTEKNNVSNCEAYNASIDSEHVDSTEEMNIPEDELCDTIEVLELPEYSNGAEPLSDSDSMYEIIEHHNDSDCEMSDHVLYNDDRTVEVIAETINKVKELTISEKECNEE